MIMVSTLFWMFFAAWLIRWAISARAAGATLQPHYEAEIARLREEVDQLNTELARVNEEQQFMMRLLSDGQTGRDAELPGQPPQPENP
jgi:hypothetical protein